MSKSNSSPILNFFIKKSTIKLKKLSNNGSNSIVVIKDPKNIIDIEYSIVCKEYYV